VLAILAHKFDLLKTGASGGASASELAVTRVRTVLERELEKRRAATSGAVGMEGLGDDAAEELGGLECTGGGGAGGFRFADWEGGEVAFVGSSVTLWDRLDVGDEKTGGGQGVRALVEWLEAQP
jgi:signal recognition particle receptor subunit beta